MAAKIATSVAGDGIAGGSRNSLSVDTGKDEFTATRQPNFYPFCEYSKLDYRECRCV